MDPTSDILDVLDCVQEYTSTTIVYSRGAVTGNVTATQLSTTYTIEGENGLLESATVVDWLVRLSLLPSGIDVPEYGDKIEVGGLEYNVLGGASGMPPYDLIDQQGLMIKIHTLGVTP